MNAGRLNKRVWIQEPVWSAASASGEKTVSRWDNVAEVWASIEPLSGREYWAAAQAQSSVTHRVTIRYREGINQTMRVLFGTRELYIESIIDPREAHRFLELVCVEQTT